MTDIQIIIDACVKANPEIVEFRCEGCHRKFAEYINGCPHCWSHSLTRQENEEQFPNRGVRAKERDIRLADVLLAIQSVPKTSKLVIDDYGVFWDLNTLANSTLQEKSFSWNLRNDSLTEQSPETLSFIASLLKGV